MAEFQLHVSNLQWIDGSRDDPEDLCLHGDVTAIIGDETITRTCTVSATALYLLKSLTEDHLFGQDNQIFPCCGHFIIANEDLTNVQLLGCPSGIDLQITHEDTGVCIVTEAGNETIIAYDTYQNVVFHFADEIKAYYGLCTPKKLPEDTFERNGYIAFWNEWERRRNG